MKALILLSVAALGHAISVTDLYPFSNQDGRVADGDSQSSPAVSLKVPIVFYSKPYDSISVHTDGFLTLERPNVDEALLAPYMTDLDTTNHGAIHYKEHQETKVLQRATRDIQKAFPCEASHFQATSVFVATWEEVEIPNSQHDGKFTFQCVLVSDSHDTFAIFLYPQDGLGVGSKVTTDIFSSFSARAGYHEEGREHLEVFETSKLIGKNNYGRKGEWIFQVGGIASLHKKHHSIDMSQVFRRQAEFLPSSVDLFGEEEAPCNLPCTDHATCTNTNTEQCCACDDAYFGNGYFCLPKETIIQFNGKVSSDLANVRYSDGREFTEKVEEVQSHAYVSMIEGRAFLVISGLSEELQRAIQPIIDFCTIYAWLFSSAEYPAVNGMSLTGGRIISRTEIRSDDFNFMVDQTFSNSSSSQNVSYIDGQISFFGTLPGLNPDDTVEFKDFTQIYTREGYRINSETTRYYELNGEVKSYEVTQLIQFDTCEGLLEDVPSELAVDYSVIFIGNQYNEIEKSVRYAMNVHARPVTSGDDVVVAPGPNEEIVPDLEVVTEAPEPPVVEVEKEEEEIEVVPGPQTECERQLDEANRRAAADPSARVQFPTCMPVGTFAPRQCSSYAEVRCWCVDQDTGVEIDGTMKEGNNAYELDCSDVKPDVNIDLTDCQIDRQDAINAARSSGSSRTSVYMPVCTDAGAYEPVQQHPAGYFMCVNFFGEETRRSNTKPDCLSPCEKHRYYSETDNIFTGTNKFMPECDPDGSYHPKQCDATSCFCVDSDGVEVEASRAEKALDLKCDDVQAPPYNEPEEVVTSPPDKIEEEVEQPVVPVQPQIPVRPVPFSGKLVYAQSMGINTLDLPISEEINPLRAYQKGGQVAVGLAYDCSSGNYFWSDIYNRNILKSDLSGEGLPEVLASSNIRSPEGVAVDFISGNVYWTDSGTDKIEVMRTDGSNRATIVSSGLYNPRGIAVDPFGGKIYWTDWNRKKPNIMVANGDGSDIQVFVRSDDGIQLPNDITIDQYRRKVCFIDAGTKKVECLNTDGSGREVLFSLPHGQTQHPFGLAVDGDMLYYSNWRSTREHMHAVNLRTNEDRVFGGPRGAHGHVYGVTIAKQCRTGYNACSQNNGGCDGLCLPTSSGRVCR